MDEELDLEHELDLEEEGQGQEAPELSMGYKFEDSQ